MPDIHLIAGAALALFALALPGISRTYDRPLDENEETWG